MTHEQLARMPLWFQVGLPFCVAFFITWSISTAVMMNFVQVDYLGNYYTGGVSHLADNLRWILNIPFMLSLGIAGLTALVCLKKSG